MNLGEISDHGLRKGPTHGFFLPPVAQPCRASSPAYPESEALCGDGDGRQVGFQEPVLREDPGPAVGRPARVRVGSWRPRMAF